MGQYNSFIVRVWTDGNGRLRGKIEHVTTHDSLIFLELEPIVGFIRSRVARAADGVALLDEELTIDLGGNVPEIPPADGQDLGNAGSISPNPALFDLTDHDSKSYDEKPPA